MMNYRIVENYDHLVDGDRVIDKNNYFSYSRDIIGTVHSSIYSSDHCDWVCGVKFDNGRDTNSGYFQWRFQKVEEKKIIKFELPAELFEVD